MSNQFLNELSKHLTSRDGQSYDIPVAGSLGLLALGDIGLTAWRQAKMAYLQQQNILSNPPSTHTNNDGK